MKKNFIKDSFTSVIALTAIFFVGHINSENALTDSEIATLETSYSQMSLSELYAEADMLINENQNLGKEIENTQNPEKIKEVTTQIASNVDTLRIIQRFILALGGAAVINEIGSDGDVSYPDRTPPTINIIGDNPATVELGGSYTDPGITASDDSGQVSTTTSGTVDTDTVGSYTITYTATDASGNSSTATRTVNVVDTTDPVLTITGDNPVSVELGSSYSDAGATAADLDTVTVTSTSDVDTDTVGTLSLIHI